jgi:hypothetical protein
MPLVKEEPMKASIATPARGAFIATCAAASTFLVSTVSQGQAGPVSGAGGADPYNAQHDAAPVNPETVSCNALKARVKSTGQLTILSGPRGAWGDAFYGPGVPRCQFWQMPVFTYVRTSDGLCGAGYICVDKMSVD